MKITSRFKVLLAEKELRDRRSYTLRDVAKATGVSIYTITGFANNTLREYPSDAIGALCGFFQCSVGELIQADVDGGGTIRGSIGEPLTEAVIAY